MSSPIVLWIWFCAFLNATGWVLSYFHALNKTGYLIAFAIGLGAWLVWRQSTGTPWLPKIHPPKLCRRFRRPFPCLFLILAALAFLGGALHDAGNYDALAYRTPRVLHWLSAGQWFWIPTDFQRLNTRTAGFEWLTAPQFLFFRTDRLVFLLNIIAFLLLPVRIFGVLTQLGVRPRTAWYWMWLFPTGYGYVLQAGSVVNDMFGALMTYAAIEFALRAARKKDVACLWTSCLAAALMTAIKAFNLLLLLPWAISAWPAARLMLRRPVASFLVILLVLSASLVPTAALNLSITGDWTGLKAEQATIGGGGKSARLIANAINLPLENLTPPVFPFTRQWEEFVQRIVPTAWRDFSVGRMEPGLAGFKVNEMQVEETSGLGAGLSLLLLVLLIKKLRGGRTAGQTPSRTGTLVVLAAWASLGVFMMQTGSAGPARYLLPFYILLVIPILRGPAADAFFRWRSWRQIAVGLSTLSVLLVVLCPARPLWPATRVLQSLDTDRSQHPLLNRALNVYSAYGARGDGFAPVIAGLPADANPLGYMGMDEPEGALWRPFLQRRIAHIRFQETPASVRARGIKYALVSGQVFAQHKDVTPAQWLAQMNAETIQTYDLKLLAGQNPGRWWLVRFN
jgi:hypothetical protein